MHIEKVNEELILMYQEVGKYISEKTKEASYGSGFVDNVAEFFSTILLLFSITVFSYFQLNDVGVKSI